MDGFDFYMGRCFDAYEYLGAHEIGGGIPGIAGTREDGKGIVFRTFAPAAGKVSILYAGREIPMVPVYDGNFYEQRIEDAVPGETYEYRVYTRDGNYTDHSDPYGFRMELRPDHKSVITSLSTYSFGDTAWMKKRSSTLDKPMNIYEMHLGSWRTKEDGSWYRYDELADLLIPYLTRSGYNYVEFMPLSEHPVDESWGYQNTGFFSPTSRYGTPDQLKYLIDMLHQNGIGVILDYVPVHFAIDSYGLARYDGTALYEYPHSDVGVSEWGSCNFMHSRGEVRSFLQSSANYWLKEFHFDGLRMDAISRIIIIIIYWQGNESRGENGNAVDFIKVMNKGLKTLNPGCILIAEDSTNYPNVTLEVDQGGLGFDYKWDMGWMHDTLEYFQAPPAARTAQYHKLTFSMMYYYKENYMLPFSHDEVVHGKAAILQKMNGQYGDKFPQARALYLYMMVHPGKKLNFMGNEICQLREWSEKREQDWDLLSYPAHDSFYTFISDLNKIYLRHPALWELDHSPEGFSWLDCHQEEKCVYILQRNAKAEHLIAAFNLSAKEQSVTLPASGASGKSLTMLICTDWEKYGGSSPVDTEVPGSSFTMAPFSAVLLLMA